MRAGLASGVMGGALDLIAGMAVYPAATGVPVIRIPQMVASGILGPRAFEGSWGSALLGVSLHFFIATVAGLVLAMAMAKVASLCRSAVLTGAGFGVAVYFFMQLIVLPLSNVPARNTGTIGLVIGLTIHVLALGIPMSLVARRFLSSERSLPGAASAHVRA